MDLRILKAQTSFNSQMTHFGVWTDTHKYESHVITGSPLLQNKPVAAFGQTYSFVFSTESLILAQDERWRRV